MEISLTGVALTAITMVALWIVLQRARRRQSLISRAVRFKTAVSRMTPNPELVATGPTIPRQLFAAVAAAALGSATRTIVAKGIQSVIDAARHHPPRGPQSRESTTRLHSVRSANPGRPTTGIDRDIEERAGLPEVAARGSSDR